MEEKRKTVTSTEVKRNTIKKFTAKFHFPPQRNLLRNSEGYAEISEFHRQVFSKSLSPILLKSTDKIKTTR